MTGIHDVFPANDEDDGDDPISEKKLKKGEGQYSTVKTLLGFDFDGINKTMWLETAKREKLLKILHGWIRTGHRGSAGIPFTEFESTVAKIWHAFTSIPMGASLLSPCNRILKLKPSYVYLNRNKRVLADPLQTADLGMAGLHRFRGCLRPRRGGGHNRGTFAMHPNSVSVAMAR